ncbi:MAG: aldehyde dehydrogenase family protein, partial [Marinomonas sp.]
MQQIDQVYIGGNWRPTQSSSLYSLINPATQDGIAQVNMASPQDVEDAVAAAHKAFASWSNTSAQTRADYMNAIADGMQARYQDLIEAHVLSMGCPTHLVGAYHLDCAIDAMRYYAKLAFNMEKETTREGVLLT